MVIQANKSQSNDLALQYDAAGRYSVRLNGNRVGEVLGGNGRWVAEDTKGVHQGARKTRIQAAQLLITI